MAMRLLVLLALVCALGAAPALAGYGDEKAAVDAKLAAVREKIARSQAKESRLESQIGGLTSQIKSLQSRVGDVSAQLSSLESDLALHQRRLDKLTQLYKLQTIRFNYLKHEYELALRRLNLRLIDIYKQNEPTTVDILLAARSFDDVLDQLDYLGAIAKQDKQVAGQVATAKLQVKQARQKTKTVRRGVQQEAHLINARVQQAAILRGQLLSSKSQLAGARSAKSRALVVTRAQVKDQIGEAQALAASSAALAAKLRASATSSSSSAPAVPSAAGLIWPVSGPITSPFGARWGSFHEGVDFGVSFGTPIHAAAAGTVVWCGWMSGYGNLVVIDHHNGLATAYGHQSSIAVGCNQSVAQGQVIGYVGDTGHSTGPHLHFEVRVNGAPVDPLGYLP
jgi:murein DD-endopeptidase MepM/ murein hydrolase activator NlpD